MKILLTGGTGLIGTALCQYWNTQGHQLFVLSRSPDKVARLCGETVQGVAQLEALDSQPLDAVINLAGAPIADRPWTDSRRKVLRESRIDLTQDLVDWLARREQRPEVLISGSAVGYYGDRGNETISEADAPGPDFASRLCADWEAEASRASLSGIRVVQIRTGLVVAHDAGFLKRMLPAFRFGLGGPLGSGQQWMPWVHLQDQVALIDFLLHRPQAMGPYNACSPNPIRNRTFARTLGKVLHRPACLPMPAPVLRLLLGELSILLLGGQQALPTQLEDQGFRFRFPTLQEALEDVL